MGGGDIQSGVGLAGKRTSIFKPLIRRVGNASRHDGKVRARATSDRLVPGLAEDVWGELWDPAIQPIKGALGGEQPRVATGELGDAGERRRGRAVVEVAISVFPKQLAVGGGGDRGFVAIG